MENFDFDRYLVDLDTYERCGWQDEYTRSAAEDEIDKIFEEASFKPVELPKFDTDYYFGIDYVKHCREMEQKRIKLEEQREEANRKKAEKLEKERQERERRKQEQREQLYHAEHQRKLAEAAKKQKQKYDAMPPVITYDPSLIQFGSWHFVYTTLQEYAEACIHKHHIESKDVAVVVSGSHYRSYNLHGYLTHDNIFGFIPIDNEKHVIVFLVQMDNKNYACVVAFNSLAYECANIRLQNGEAMTALFRFNLIHEKLKSAIYGYTTDTELTDKIDDMIRSLQCDMLDEISKKTGTDKWDYPIDCSYNAVSTRQCFGKDCFKCPMQKHCVDIQHESESTEYVNNIYIRDGWV